MNQGVLVAVVVLIALLAQTATSQVTELPQCTVEELTLPKSIAFLNSSLSVQVGMSLQQAQSHFSLRCAPKTHNNRFRLKLHWIFVFFSTPCRHCRIQLP